MKGRCRVEDLLLSRAMARIRRYLSEIDPEARPYFLLSTNDDHVGHLVNMGLNPARRQLSFTSATLVLMVNAMILGAFGALVVASWGWSLESSAAIGVLIEVVTLLLFCSSSE
jgi:hypothetical protein